MGIGEPPVTHDARVPSADEIRRQLRTILTNPAFLGSKRSQQFLEYVCEKSLAGAASALKERMIAIEVFGRPAQSDLGEDTIVRVSAREVRKRIAQFYASPEGAAAEVRVDLPSGSYAPEFHYNAPPVAFEAAAPVVTTVAAPRRTWLLTAAAVSIALVVLSAWLLLPRGSANARSFNQFWDPVFAAPEPVLVAVAHPIVYHVSGRAAKLSAENQPPAATPLQRPIQVPPEKLNGNDIIPVINQYVGFGDMVVATEVSSMLAAR